MATKALEGKNATLSTTYSEVLGANPYRRKLRIHNKDSSIGISHMSPRKNNPWSLSFDGTGDYIAGDVILPLIWDAPDFTLVMALKTDNPAAADVLFSITDASTANEVLSIGTNVGSKLSATLTIGGTDSWVMASVASLVADTWYVLELYHDGTKPKVKLDGAVLAVNYTTITTLSDWISAMSPAVVDSVTIGASAVSGGYSSDFNGDIDFVYLYTSQQKTTPIALYDLDEGTGTTAGDGSTNSNDLTITGTGTWAIREDGSYLIPTATEIISLDGHDGASVTKALWVVADSGTPVVNVKEWEI